VVGCGILIFSGVYQSEIASHAAAGFYQKGASSSNIGDTAKALDNNLFPAQGFPVYQVTNNFIQVGKKALSETRNP
jgi:hypothetical protein